MTATLLLTLLAGASPQFPVLECQELPLVFQALEEAHYAKAEIARVADQRSVEQFVESLDPSRTLLLANDVKKLEKSLPRVFKTMKAGNCGVLNEAWKLVISRSKDNERIVAKLLGKSYALDESVELNLDPKKRGYAKTQTERQSLIEKMVHFQVSNQLIAGTKLGEAKKRVVHRYELATKRLEERATNRELPGLYAAAFAGGLDPHTAYLSARTLADFEISMRLSLEGIGAALTSRDGFTIIQSIVPGGQADKQNILRTKDKILAVAQEKEAPVSVIDMDLRDVVAMIRGPKGTKVTLTVLREGKKTKTFDVTIVRDKIDVKEQAAKITYEKRKVGGRSIRIGVLDLPSFYGGDRNGRSSYRDVKRLLEEAAPKVDGIVLDLSKNGGGLLRDAVRISGLFIKTGAVVATKSSAGEVEVLEDEDDGISYRGPLVVLTSPASASASEIVAGALQDYQRAVIIGSEHTFGKGTVQMLSGLPGGAGAIKVTTGMFFRPAGASTQRVGVASDVEIPSLFADYDIGEDTLDHSLPPQRIRSFVSSTANFMHPKKRWQPVNARLIDALRQKSKARVGSSKVFEKLAERIADSKKNRGKVKLGELRQKAKGEDNSEDAKENEYEEFEKAVTEEAINVLADLATQTSKK